ncbi:hypothetical protein SUGI_0785760 [Cryptomeria japonica]|uniref:uncharacterized protein LOC131074260 n=1 Tax=Cryptomeria japonica TaxID=3369 RepID=UPI0024146BB4|nr:uncharacterized protein LOC131074260 [Cryptomeria japonica]GLJ38553.1 hypothetical protein SUGI_0785760 [Cryptomeria japonica]
MGETFYKDPYGRGTYSWPPRIPRRTITIAFLSTLGVAGVGWLLFSQEPFASKLEPLTSEMKKLMRGTKPPTVPTEKDGVIAVEGPVVPSHPKSRTLSATGIPRGQAEGRNIQGVKR